MPTNEERIAELARQAKEQRKEVARLQAIETAGLSVDDDPRAVELARRSNKAQMTAFGIGVLLTGICGAIIVAMIEGSSNWDPFAGFLSGLIVGILPGTISAIATHARFEKKFLSLRRSYLADVFAKYGKRLSTVGEDLDAFSGQLGNLSALEGLTENYEAVLDQASARLAELGEALAPVQAEVKDVEDRLAETRRQAANRRRLDELNKNISALIPSSGTGRITKDITPHVAVLQARDRLDQPRLDDLFPLQEVEHVTDRDRE